MTYFTSKYAALVYTRDKRLDEVPGVARGIKKNNLKKKLFLEKKLRFLRKRFMLLSIGTHGFPQNISAHPVQSFGQL